MSSVLYHSCSKATFFLEDTENPKSFLCSLLTVLMMLVAVQEHIGCQASWNTVQWLHWKYLCGFGGESQFPRLHTERFLHVTEPRRGGENTQHSSSPLPALCSDIVRHTRHWIWIGSVLDFISVVQNSMSFVCELRFAYRYFLKQFSCLEAWSLNPRQSLPKILE